MSVTLKLARHGMRSKPFYRMVASVKGAKRDGKYIEIVGTYDPKMNPAKITLKEDRVRYWISVGAQTTEMTRSIIRKSIPNLIEEREKNKLTRRLDSRKKRKARLKARKK